MVKVQLLLPWVASSAELLEALLLPIVKQWRAPESLGLPSTFSPIWPILESTSQETRCRSPVSADKLKRPTSSPSSRLFDYRDNCQYSSTYHFLQSYCPTNIKPFPMRESNKSSPHTLDETQTNNGILVVLVNILEINNL